MGKNIETHLWHNGLAVLVRDILEGHLGALVLTELELGVCDVRNLIQRCYYP